MKPPLRPFASVLRAAGARPRRWLLPWLLAWISPAIAQSVVPPPGGQPATPAASQPAMEAPAGPVVSPAMLSSPFAWAGISLLPHLLYRTLYSDGLLAQPGHPLSSYIRNFAPGILLKGGDRWLLDYTPTWTRYSNPQLRNTFDQAVNFMSTLPLADWQLQFDQRYATTSGIMMETGRQTGQEVVATNIGLSHAFTSKLALDLNGAQTLNFIENANDNFDWTGTGWLHYQLAPRLGISAGGSGGYIQIFHSPDIVNLNPGVRLNWLPTDAISLQGRIGLQKMIFTTGGRANLNTISYSGSAQYHPWVQTTLIVMADRGVTPSFFTGDVRRNDTWRINLNQRLLQHFHLSVGYTEGRSRYIVTQNSFVRTTGTRDITDQNGNVIGTTTTTTLVPVITFFHRRDVHRSLSLRLETTWLKRGTVAVTYQRSINHSNAPGYGYVSRQIGCEVGWKY